jgi:hypothetical protein
MDTPIRPLKGRELRARVQYLDDAIAQLKKDIGELRINKVNEWTQRGEGSESWEVINKQNANNFIIWSY